MTIPQVNVSVDTYQLTGAALANATVRLTLTRPDIVAATGEIVALGSGIIACDSSGQGSGPFFPNAAGTQGTQYLVEIFDAAGLQVFPAPGRQVPAVLPTSDCALHACLFMLPPLSVGDAQAAVNQARDYALQAQLASASSVTLVDGPAIDWNADSVTGGRTAKLTLSTNQATRVLHKPTNLLDGVLYALKVTNHPAGGQDITFDSAYVLNGAVIDTVAGAVTLLLMLAVDGQLLVVNTGAGGGIADHAPSAAGQNLAVYEGMTYSGTLTGSDPDVGDVLTFEIVTPPAHGTATITDATSGAFTYTPSVNYEGSDSFTFRVSDGRLFSSDATVSFNITNPAPVAVGASYSTAEDTPYNGTLVASDPNDPSLTYSIVAAPAHGAVNLVDAIVGIFTYTPSLNYNGPDSFTFKANDGKLDSNIATVSLTVTAVNDPPVATAGTAPVTQDTAYNGVLVGSDVEGPVTFAIATNPAHGTLSGLNANTGAYTYTPNAAYLGPDSFTFTTTDNQGAVSSPATVSITVAAVVYPAKSGTYTSNFSGVADNTPLRTLPGWSAIDVDANASAGELDAWKIIGGNIVCTLNDGGTPGKAIFVRETGSTDHVMSFKAVVVDGNDQFVVAATDEKNCISLTVGTDSWTINKVVAGVQTQLATDYFNNAGKPLKRALAAGDAVKVMVLGNTLWLSLADILMTPTGVDLTGFTKGTKVGLGNYFSATAPTTLNTFYCAAQTAAVNFTGTGLALYDPNHFAVFWPGLVGSGRQVSIPFVYQGAVSALDARVVDEVSRAVIQDWARLSSTKVTMSAGAGTALVQVPMGSNAHPTVNVQLRAANDTDAVAQTTPTTVGKVLGSYGQSGSGAYASILSAPYSSPNGYVRGSQDADLWYEAGDNSYAAGGLTNVVQPALGVPIGFKVGGFAGAGIDTLVNSGGVPGAKTEPYYDDFLFNAQAAPGSSYGFFYGIEWIQGEGEALGSSAFDATAKTTYRSYFAQLLTQLRAGVLADNGAPIGVAPIGYFGDLTTADARPKALQDSNWNAVQQCTMSLLDLDPLLYVSAHFVDLEYRNDIGFTGDWHLSPNGSKEAARRAGLSLLKKLGLGAYDGQGPIVTSIARSGTKFVCTLNLNGATSLTGTNVTGWQYSTDGGSTWLTPTSVNVVGTTIEVNTPGTLSAPGMVRSYYGVKPDRTTFAKGNYADGTSIAVRPLYTAMSST